MRLPLTSAAFLAAIASAAPAENGFAEREKVPYDCSATSGHPVLKAFKRPENSASASAFCSSFLQQTVTRTRRAVGTVDATSTVTEDTLTVPGAHTTVTVTDVDHAVTVTTTATVTPLAKRDVVVDPPYPDFIPSSKPSGLVKAACKCIVTPPAKKTVTSTIFEGESATKFIATVTAPGPTVTKDVIETATATPTSYITQNLICGNRGCRSGEVDPFPGGMMFNTYQECVANCVNTQGCDFVQYGATEHYCFLFPGTIEAAYDPGSLPYCPDYAFYDKRCT